MGFNTNDINVAKLELSWEICKNISPRDGVEGKSYQINSEEFAKKMAEIVTEVFNKLPPSKI